MMLSPLDALGPIADAFLAQYYFSTAEDERSVSQVHKRLSFVILLLLIPLAQRGLGVHTLARFFLRVACYFLYLVSAKGASGRRCLYLSVFTASCFTAGNNIFLSPLTYSLLAHPALVEFSSWLNPLISIAVQSLILIPLRFFLPLKHIEQPSSSAWVALWSTVLCIMVTRNMRWLGDGFSRSGSLLFILLQIFMMLFLVMSQREHYANMQKSASRLQNVLNEERLKQYESQYRADENIRSLHHDMKNHLLAIRTMAKSDNGNLNAYLDDLILEIQSDTVPIETGSHILDGLLCQKLPILKKLAINHDLILDFRTIDFISDMDLCTIFGNLIDNAVEACQKVDTEEKRFINIHSEAVAGQLIISFVNSYSGAALQMRNGLPITSKADSYRHGLGLSNVRKVVRKYGGVAEVDVSVPEQFSFTILIPIPQPQAQT